MENSSVSYDGTITYNLDISYSSNILHLKLKTQHNSKAQTYLNSYKDDDLPPQLQAEKKSCEDVFTMLQNRKNFEVDPVRAIISLIIIKPTFIEEDEHIEQRIGFEL